MCDKNTVKLKTPLEVISQGISTPNINWLIEFINGQFESGCGVKSDTFGNVRYTFKHDKEISDSEWTLFTLHADHAGWSNAEMYSTHAGQYIELTV